MTSIQTSSTSPSTQRPPGGPRAPRPAASTPRAGAAVTTIDPIRVLRQYMWWIALSVVVGAVLGVAAHYLIAWTMPIYSATTVWEVNQPKREAGSVDELASVTGEMMDRSIATAAAMMTGTNVLRPAISSPEVRRTDWIKPFMDESGNIQMENALSDLQDRVRASFGSTFLIQLQIRGRKKEDLVTILTAINNEYQRDITRRKVDALRDVEAPFTTQKEALQRRIQTLNDEIATRIEREKINLNVQDSDQAMALALVRQAINQRMAEMGMMVASLSAANDRLSQPSLVFNDSERALARQDPNIVRLEGETIMLRTDLRNALQRFGAEHLTIKRLQERLSAAETELETELDSVMRRNFLAQVESARNAIQSLQQILAQLEQERAASEARLNDLLKAVEWVNNKKSELAAVQEQLATLDATIAQAVMVASMERTLAAKLTQRPEAEGSLYFPRLALMLPLGVVLCGGLVTGGVFGREVLDRRLRGPGCIALLPHGRVAGVIPHGGEGRGLSRLASIDALAARPSGGVLAAINLRPELAVVDATRSVLAEAFRSLYAGLARRMNESGHRVLLVVGAQAGSGATTVLSNVAASFAGSERRVLVVDGNFRRPRLAEVFGVAAGPGLGDVLSGAASLEQAVQDCRVEKVSVLTAGSEGHRAVELLTTPRLARIMGEAKQKFDVVLVDSPAAVVAGDWLTLAEHVDATLLVVRAMQEERGLAARLIGQLREARPEHLGVVINAVRSAAGGYMKRNLRQMEAYQRDARPGGAAGRLGQ